MFSWCMGNHWHENLAGWDWKILGESLDRHGHAVTPLLLGPDDCGGLVEMYDDDGRFRSSVDMARLGFGEGSYRYFADPLPPLVAELRAALYPPLADIGNDWAGRLDQPAPYPDDLDAYLDVCHRAGQTKPTPLLLRYHEGGFNCLHRDLYGEHAFPLQVVVVLDQVGRDYRGGELVLVENRMRAQSRAAAITVDQGCAVIFPNRYRPVRSSRGWARADLRHGVSPLHEGRRHSLGLIFHDAA